MNTLWFPVLSDRFPGSRGSISISSGFSPSSESRGSPGFLVLVAFVVLLKMNGYKPGNETLSTSAGRRPFFLISPVSLWHKEVSFEQRGTTLTKISGEKEVTVNHAGCVQLDRFCNKENVLQMFPFTRVSVALLCYLHIKKHGIYTRVTPRLYLLSTMWKRRKTST